jgi:cytochrome P450
MTQANTVSTVKSIPKAPAFPLIGVLPHIARQGMLDYLVANSQKFPEISKLKLGPVSMYAVSCPELAEEVLKRTKDFGRGELSKRTQFVFGDGLVASDGEIWLKHRRMMQPQFHQRQVVYLTDIIRNTTAEVLNSKWQVKAASGQSFDLWTELGYLIQKTTMRMLFGGEISDAEVETIGAASRLVFDSLLPFAFLTFMPQKYIPGYSKVMRAVTQIDEIIKVRIDEARQKNADAPTLLNMLLQAQDDETNTTMTDKQVRDEIITLYSAGHETTSFTVAITLYLLAKNPQYLQILRQEYATVLGANDPTVETVMQLKKTIATVRESIRFYSPAPFFPREALQDTQLGGYQIPKGSNMIVVFHAIHRNEAVWDDANTFNPERFGEELTLNQKKYFFGFSAGPHRCIGEHLALAEAATILAMILKRYNVEITNLDAVKIKPGASLSFEVAPQVKLIPR